MSVNPVEGAKAALKRYWASCRSPEKVTQAMAEEVGHPLFIAGRTSAEIAADFKTFARPALAGLVRTLERLAKPVANKTVHACLAPGEIPGASSWKIS